MDDWQNVGKAALHDESPHKIIHRSRPSHPQGQRSYARGVWTPPVTPSASQTNFDSHQQQRQQQQQPGQGQEQGQEGRQLQRSANKCEDYAKPSEYNSQESQQHDNAQVTDSDFHPFVRAFFPYHPVCDADPTTVTLPLQSGDVVLVHSVRANGWADGTLIATGCRGWLPTNYCEPYSNEAIDDILDALTVFWDIVKGSSDDGLHVFKESDYARRMVAGVRSLLVCLTFMLVEQIHTYPHGLDN